MYAFGGANGKLLGDVNSLYDSSTNKQQMTIDYSTDPETSAYAPSYTVAVGGFPCKDLYATRLSRGDGVTTALRFRSSCAVLLPGKRRSL